MIGKGDTNRRYRVHGDGLDSLWSGLIELGMPEHRRTEALAIVREILDANDVVDFRWYKTEGTDELACYWDNQPSNVLWVTTGEVHIPEDTQRVKRPDRPTNWQKGDGAYVGWQLSGADSGTGGGRQKPATRTVLCPETFIHYPVGSMCPSCEVVHG